MKAYLAGTILKGDQIGKIKDWRIEYTSILSSIGIEILSPHDVSLDENDPMQIFGHDCFLVKETDIVVVYAPEKIGVGTAQEMVIAKLYNKLVVSVIPLDSYYHRRNLFMECGIIENWMHPFMVSFSDIIVNSADSLVETLRDTDIANIQIKSISVVEEAISYYLKKRNNNL